MLVLISLLNDDLWVGFCGDLLVIMDWSYIKHDHKTKEQLAEAKCPIKNSGNNRNKWNWYVNASGQPVWISHLIVYTDME